MADILRIKRRVSGAPGAPGTLQNAELAYNEADHTLYYGEGTGGAGGSATVVVPIGGTGFFAPLASPTFTGTAHAPIFIADTGMQVTAGNITALSGNVSGTNVSATATMTVNGVNVATTAQLPIASSTTPLMDGTAAVGVGTTFARPDHIHPTDTSRAPLASPTFTGTAHAPTFVADTGISVTAGNITAPSGNVSAGNVFATTTMTVGGVDVATTAYVDMAVQGLNTKPACAAASTGNLTLSGAQTVDGITVNVGDRVLVKNQTTTGVNGIYTVAVGAWTRALDMDAWAEVPDAYVFIMQGTVNADTGWVCTSDPGGVLGSTPITWAQFSAAGQVTPGNGLQKVGNTLSVLGTASRIVVGAAVDIDPAYVGQASITTLGTVASGTWNATTIAVSRGGTGATTLTGYVKGNGASAMTASATIPNADIAGLGSMALQSAGAVAITGGTIDGVTFDGGVF